MIVLHSYFHLTNKSNLIGRLNTIFLSFGSGYFLDHPVYSTRGAGHVTQFGRK